ncbi:MAG: nitrile hydratase subunit beta [Candidatus Lambdaproteobacteria bacterium]|nr:nitrile hydratase subunit beta [Candidatus Lambdaproteobacteria bacterium]
MSENFTFGNGDRVRVRTATPPGHCRTPTYLRGHIGVVEAQVGHFRYPEELAYGKDGLPKRALYRVRFAQRSLWPAYPGPAVDTVAADLFEPWLERSQE